MPPALILSQDQTLQFNGVFPALLTHYLVFKEQSRLVWIIDNFVPLSRGLFSVNSSPPAAATVFVTDPLFPVKHLFAFFLLDTKLRGRPFSQALQAHNHKRKAKP
jgi:hypothetical protein